MAWKLTIPEKKEVEKRFIERYGFALIEGNEHNEIEEVFVGRDMFKRVKHLENILYHGIEVTKLTGEIPSNGKLMFNTPTSMEFSTQLNSSGQCEPFKIYLKIFNRKVRVNAGITYYFGVGNDLEWDFVIVGKTVPFKKWSLNIRNKMEEMYLYIKSFDLVNDNITIVAFVLMPLMEVYEDL